MNLLQNLGVQSYCFRHFPDNATVAAKVRGIGLENIELCAVHANFDDPASFSPIAKIYADSGVGIVSLGVQTFTGADREKAWFECAALAGATHISAHFQIATFQQAIPRVREWVRGSTENPGAGNTYGQAYSRARPPNLSATPSGNSASPDEHQSG
ncbi:MAG: hypothetical protein ACOVMP_04260 [Chthoniobacterales bacterium]